LASSLTTLSFNSLILPLETCRTSPGPSLKSPCEPIRSFQRSTTLTLPQSWLFNGDPFGASSPAICAFPAAGFGADAAHPHISTSRSANGIKCPLLDLVTTFVPTTSRAANGRLSSQTDDLRSRANML